MVKISLFHHLTSSPFPSWGEEESNLRRLRQQIYSLPHLTALVSPRGKCVFGCDRSVSVVYGKGCGCDCGIKIIQRTNVGISGVPYFLSRWTGSNRRQADYKSAALPAELHRHLFASNRCTHKYSRCPISKKFLPRA